MAKQRLLIFGGTFDPPHAAHAVLPPLVARRLRCERILYIPAAVNPLKTDTTTTPPSHRLAMLRLALARVPDAQVSTIELDRPGPSYTVDTLEHLRKAVGDTELRLLIGSDQAVSFQQWKDWPRILDLASPVVMLRPPLDAEAYEHRLGQVYSKEEAARWLAWTADVPFMDICATDLRRRLAANDDVRGLIPSEVLAYIRAHGLYRS